jgi:hypothetical protein
VLATTGCLWRAAEVRRWSALVAACVRGRLSGGWEGRGSADVTLAVALERRANSSHRLPGTATATNADARPTPLEDDVAWQARHR